MANAIKKPAQPATPPLRKAPRAYGGHFTAIVDGEGKTHAYLNAAIPTDRNGQPIAPLYTAVCEVCGHAYAALMGSGTVCCDECRGDMTALRALAFQDECGVDLGWKRLPAYLSPVPEDLAGFGFRARQGKRAGYESDTA